MVGDVWRHRRRRLRRRVAGRNDRDHHSRGRRIARRSRGSGPGASTRLRGSRGRRAPVSVIGAEDLAAVDARLARLATQLADEWAAVDATLIERLVDLSDLCLSALAIVDDLTPLLDQRRRLAECWFLASNAGWVLAEAAAREGVD